MSNSNLVNYTKLSPNFNPRQSQIRKITIHHMAGNLSVEGCGNLFAPTSRQTSSNYGVGSDGRVGMYVEEHNRAWTSSSPDNDHQAITIEVANDGGAPEWHVSDAALSKTIDLCVDICQRNGITKLVYTGDASGNLTRHDMFAKTNCPGPYLGSKFNYIADEVNKRLGVVPAPQPTPAPTQSLDDVAQAVMRGEYGNGPARAAALTSAGYDANAVQARVNELLGASTQPAPNPSVSITEIAQAVLRGEYGNGNDRRQALANAGYDYDTVQAEVNRLAGVSPVPQPAVSLDDIARAVIRGDYGNGADRRQALANAGYDYDAVQARVNQLLG